MVAAAARGRASQIESDTITLKLATASLSTALEHIVRVREPTTTPEHAIDQVRLAIRLLGEFIRSNTRSGRDFALNRQHGQRRYHERRARGLCGRCDEPAIEGQALCVKHRRLTDESTARQRADTDEVVAPVTLAALGRK